MRNDRDDQDWTQQEWDSHLSKTKRTTLNDATPHEWDLTAALERQIGGNHYKEMNIQPVEFIMSNNMGYCAGNIVKYACLLYTSPSPRDRQRSRMPSSA